VAARPQRRDCKEQRKVIPELPRLSRNEVGVVAAARQDEAPSMIATIISASSASAHCDLRIVAGEDFFKRRS